MNEQLQQALAQIIDKSMSGLDKTVDFLSAEVPDVIHQLLLWYGVKSAIIGLLGISIIVCCLLWMKRVFKRPEDGKSNIWWSWSAYYEKHELTPEIGFNMFLVLPLIPATIMTTDIMEALQIWIAPKLWLIEYASNLVK